MDTSRIAQQLDAWMASVQIHEDDGPRSSMLQAAMDTMETPASITVGGTADVAQQQNTLYDLQTRFGTTSSEAVEQMLKAPATGLMHVSDMARQKAGWSPVTLGDSPANSAAYQDYLNRLTAFPLLTINFAQRQQLDRKTSNWDDLINSIADTFKGIEGSDRDAIVSGLKNLAQAATSTMSVEQKTSLFCQNALNVANNAYEFYLYSSTCTFQEQKGKGFDTKQNTFDLLQVKLSLKYELWTREYVSKIIGQTSASLDDWINDNSTSLDGTSPIPALNG